MTARAEDSRSGPIHDCTQDTINQTGQQNIQRHVQVAPTLTTEPGSTVWIIMIRDLVLHRYRNHPRQS